MVELPCHIGDKKITDVLYGLDNEKFALTYSIPNMLERFIELTLNNPKNDRLVLTDFISSATENSDVIQAKEKHLRSLIPTYFRRSSHHERRGSNNIMYATFSSQQEGSVSHRLNWVRSTQPEGGVYKIGLQFGTVDAGQRSDFSTPVKRDLKAEENLAKQLMDLFGAVASYGQPQLNR